MAAEGDPCPLLVLWAPKCICLHLSGQQSSRGKQNSTPEDPGSWKLDGLRAPQKVLRRSSWCAPRTGSYRRVPLDGFLSTGSSRRVPLDSSTVLFRGG